MRRLILTLVVWLSLASPLVAQTTLYFPESTAAAIAPDVDAGWEEPEQVLRRKLEDAKGSSAITIGQTVVITDDTGNQAVDRQFISTRMDASIAFTSGVTTVTSYVLMRELAGTDNVNQCILGVRVLSEDGATVRATLLAVANYGTAAEFNTAYRNKQCANGDTVTASYTTVEGDRLVVEYGYATTGADTTPQASAKWGENAADCAENETDATDCAGWIRFSNTITFAGELTPAGNMKSLPLTGVGDEPKPAWRRRRRA